MAIILAGIVWSCSDDKEDSLFRLQVDNTDVTISSINTPVILTITMVMKDTQYSRATKRLLTAEISGTTINSERGRRRHNQSHRY